MREAARMRRRTAAAVVAAAVALAGAAAVLADSGRPKIKYNHADQAAARASVLRRSDFGAGWSGGPTKPDLSPAPTCRNYHPKQADLVLTGAAASEYQTPKGIDFLSQVQVLKTAHMVRLDWRRSVVVPGAVSCLRRSLAKSLGSRAKLLSFAKIPFPHVGTYTAAFRAVVDVPVPGRGNVRVVVDVAAFGRRRSEITLTGGSPVSSRSEMAAAERRLARTLLGRARA